MEPQATRPPAMPPAGYLRWRRAVFLSFAESIGARVQQHSTSCEISQPVCLLRSSITVPTAFKSSRWFAHQAIILTRFLPVVAACIGATHLAAVDMGKLALDDANANPQKPMIAFSFICRVLW